MLVSFALVARLAVALLAASSLTLASAGADEFAPLKNRTIRIIASGGPGSSSDLYARAFADGLKEVVPEVTVGVQSVTGAGGSVALKELIESKGNLLTVAVFGGGALYNQILGTATLDLDLNDIQWIGVFGGDRRVLGLRRDFGTSFEAIRTSDVQPLLLGQSPRTLSVLDAKLLNAISGVRIRIASGFDEGQRKTMVLSGDADLLFQPYNDLAPLFESDDLVPILRYSRDGYPAELDGVPILADVAVEETAPEIIELMLAFNEFSQLFGAAPATGAEDVAALRAAFEKVVTLTTYAERLRSQHLVNMPKSGSDVAKHIGKLLGQPDKTNQILKAALDCGERISQGAVKSCK